MSSLGGYVQDEWKVQHNLTLTLGFRIEHAATRPVWITASPA